MDQNVPMLLAKLIEEKHTYTYKKLVVPVSMRSIYWKYFGFPATDEGEILTRVKIVCILCKTQIAYNRNTSNLRMHLQNKHAHELLELETANPPRRHTLDPKEKRAQKRVKTNSAPHIFTTVADGTVQIDGDIHFITDPNISFQGIEDDGSSSNQNVRVVLKGSSPSMGNQNVAIILPEENTNSQTPSMVDGKTISDAIAEFVILDLQLPDVVQGRGFQSLIGTLCSPCEIPSKTKLEGELIPRIYETFKESVQSVVSSHQDEMGLSIEEWISANGESFITISVHFQQSFDPVLETKVLSTLHCGSEMDSVQWGNVFEAFLTEWEIKFENITAVVAATTRQEILEALSDRGLTIVPCLVHSLQLCTNICFEQPEIVNILNKCRSVLALISHNNSLNATLKMQEQVMQLDENILKMDYPRVWTSTYVMLEQLLMRKNIIQSILNSSDNIDKDECILTEGDWKIMEDLVMVLEPFKVTIMTLSEEKTPLISLLKPLLCQLNNSHLKVKDSDSENAKQFKAMLSEHLTTRYCDPAVDQLLHTATMLDPRFKLLPYANGDDKNIISGTIKEMLVKFVEEKQLSDGEMGEEPPDKKSRLSGMEILLGSLCNSKNGMPAEERADLELVQYQSESIAALDHCPLHWWAKASAKCPSLARLARKYNCVPASASPPHRIPMESQVLFDIRRATLEPEIVEKLIFLNGNHSV